MRIPEKIVDFLARKFEDDRTVTPVRSFRASLWIAFGTFVLLLAMSINLYVCLEG